jgi:hypothetical protein
MREGPPVLIEIVTFNLAPGADEAAFLAADQRLQADIAIAQRGLIRRTTARGADGGWLVLTLWASDAAADGAPSLEDAGVSGFVDRATLARSRYTSLD